MSAVQASSPHAPSAQGPSLVQRAQWIHRAKDGFLKIWSVVVHRKTFLTEIVGALFIAALFFISWPAALVACCVVPLVIWIERSKVAPLEKENRELKVRNEEVNANNQLLSMLENTQRVANERLQTDLTQVQDERDRAKELWEREMPTLSQERDQFSQKSRDLARKLEEMGQEKTEAIEERDRARAERSEEAGRNEQLLLEKLQLQEKCNLLAQQLQEAVSEKTKTAQLIEQARITGKSQLTCERDSLLNKTQELERQMEQLVAQKNEATSALQVQKLDFEKALVELQTLRKQLKQPQNTGEFDKYLSQLQEACHQMAESDLSDTSHQELNALLLDFEQRKATHCQKLQAAIEECGDNFQRRIPLLGALQLFQEQSDLLTRMGQMIGEKLEYYAGLKTLSDRFSQAARCGLEASL